MGSFPSGQKVTILQGLKSTCPKEPTTRSPGLWDFPARAAEGAAGGPVVMVPPQIHPNQQHPSFAHLSSRPWGWSHLSSQVEQTELTPHEYQLGRLHQEVLILYYLQVFDLSWMRSDTARLVLLVGAKQGRKSLWMGMMQQLPAEKKLLVQLRGSQCCRLPKLFPYQWLL